MPRQTKRASTRAMGRKPYDKKMRRLSVQSKYKKPVSHEQTSDSEVPQKLKKRRTQSYTATSSYRTYRRKKTPLSSASNTSTRVADKSDSSSDYDDDDDGFGDARNGNLPSTSTGPVLDVNIPSTSTGITANGKGFLFRIANAANDSDDDDQSIPDSSADNMLRVLRSPPIHNNNNNHRAHFATVNEGAGTSTQRGSFLHSSLRHQHDVPPNGRKKHQQTQEDDSSSSKCVEDYASTNSNSLMSSTESSNDSYPGSYYSKKRKLSEATEVDENGNDATNNNSSSFNNNNSFNTINNNYANGAGGSSNTSNGCFGTPSSRLKLTPDSGNSSLPTPSPSSLRGSANNGSQADVMKKIEIIKRNYRKNIHTSDDDSD